MKGSHYAANCSGFCQGFYIHGLVPKSQGPKGAKDIIDECRGSSKSFTVAQGLRSHLPAHPQDQQMRHLWPFGRAPPVTCCQWILATTSGPWSDHLPGSALIAGLEGYHQWGVGPSYLLSHPRGQSTTPGPRHLLGISEEPEVEHRESGCDANSNPQQRPAPHYGSHHQNNPGHHPQQAPGTQGQGSEGGEGKTKKSPTEAPVFVPVAKKKGAPEEGNSCSWMHPLPPGLSNS